MVFWSLKRAFRAFSGYDFKPWGNIRSEKYQKIYDQLVSNAVKMLQADMVNVDQDSKNILLHIDAIGQPVITFIDLGMARLHSEFVEEAKRGANMQVTERARAQSQYLQIFTVPAEGGGRTALS